MIPQEVKCRKHNTDVCRKLQRMNLMIKPLLLEIHVFKVGGPGLLADSHVPAQGCFFSFSSGVPGFPVSM